MVIWEIKRPFVNEPIISFTERNDALDFMESLQGKYTDLILDERYVYVSLEDAAEVLEDELNAE